MKMRWFQQGFWALLLVALALPARGADPNPAGRREGRPEPRERVQDARKLLEEVMLARLTKELALDEEQSVLLLRYLSEHREAMASMRKERAQLVRALREAVRESKDEDQIASLLAEVNGQDEKIATARREFQEFTGLELTVWQRARLFLFTQEFEADMRRLLKQAQQRREDDAQRRAPGPPAPETQGGQTKRPESDGAEEAPSEE